MEKFTIDIITKTFERCYPMQIGLKSAVETQNTYLLNEYINSLAIQSGIRKNYIKDNLNTIINL